MAIGTLGGVISYLLAPKDIYFTYSQKYSYFDHFQFGHVNFLIILILFPPSLFSAKLGIYLNKRLRNQTIRYLFIGLVFVLAARILFT